MGSCLRVKDIHDLLHVFPVAVTAVSLGFHNQAPVLACWRLRVSTSPSVSLQGVVSLYSNLRLSKFRCVQVSVCQSPCVSLRASKSYCNVVSISPCVQFSMSPSLHAFLCPCFVVSMWTHDTCPRVRVDSRPRVRVSMCPRILLFYIRTGVILKNYNFTGSAFQYPSKKSL